MTDDPKKIVVIDDYPNQITIDDNKKTVTVSPSTRKWIFSLVSGMVYSVEADEVKNLDKDQVLLVSKPTQHCKKCYDRRYTGRNTLKNFYQPCTCLIKLVDPEAFKDIEIKTLKTTSDFEQLPIGTNVSP